MLQSVVKRVASGLPGAGDARDRLNKMFAEQTHFATPGQRAAVTRWQAKDRYYEQVQRAAQGDPDASDDARRVASDLHDLARPLLEDVQVWRGSRSVSDSFHVGIGELCAGTAHITAWFVAATIDPAVARDEFTRPGRDPAVFKITAKAGTGAIWIPPIGDPDEAYQGELLVMPGSMLRILAVNTMSGLPVIEAEVSRP